MTLVSLARWHPHVNATRPPSWLRDWLTQRASLTAQLRAHCGHFVVRPIRQGIGYCLRDECRAIGLPRPVRVVERDVLLQCDGTPVIFAHTVMPLTMTRADWPAFHALGAQSLGSLLFHDPCIQRGSLQFARLPSDHPLIERIHSTIPAERLKSRLHARRCLFRRQQGRMLVTEVFLPQLLHLSPEPRWLS